MEYSSLIIIIPFVIFFLLGLLGKRIKSYLSGLIGTIGVGVCVVIAYVIFYQYFFKIGKINKVWREIIPLNFKWFHFTDKLQIDLGILLDPISIMMLVVITTVSFIVHIYSLGYMRGESGEQRYYAFLSLFVFSMLGLVLATNIFQMYIFWELVGVSSYLLIGFYYARPMAVVASKKAFIVTRFADFGFLVGILILSYYTKTFNFNMLIKNNAALVTTLMKGEVFCGLSVITWVFALIFIGAAGKSAIFPLHIWLPDAMEGPTPASALIHAATMVVSGVYLIARLFPVYFFASHDVLKMIVFIGTFTALFGSIVAITQNDIKRVLAFSTISQISYMMVAIGISGYGGCNGSAYMASMFHLFTHAFFKSLLFLGAGSVIHLVHTNDINNMGGLHKYMPVTSISFFIACLSIVGVPPFSGFYSKDEILTAAFYNQPIVFWILLIIVGLTSFYMFRLYFLVFWNHVKKFNVNHVELHESSILMLIPLIVLSLFSVFGGLVPFSIFISTDSMSFHTRIDWTVAFMSIIVIIIGIVSATFLYLKKNDKSTKIAIFCGKFYKIVLHRFYLNEIWLWMTRIVIFKCICIPIKWFDKHVIDNSINELGLITQKISFSIKLLQSGKLQFYILIFLAGVIGLTAISFILLGIV
ncbi:MAG: NADH-quinone oxidoreductase subunit L [Bacteroidales bacterium OttesenSCG-928-I14]|jgi:NADH-quinone oxidoreductase subunit L|nr:NADH-quinone oxidoreductase subunit L [Bacteroidales bacterium OttesenSCG-928-I14]